MDMLWLILGWIVFGLIAGAIARLLVPGRQPIGILGTIVLGVIGSFVGGFLGNLLFGGGDVFAPTAAGWIGSILGAIIVLLIWLAIAKRSGGGVAP
ncbi:MAG: GlsB/YeaQ/YmgE family stress response membrane protein [Planctomycetaceae bacterium]